jgi:hypothetical protein
MPEQKPNLEFTGSWGVKLLCFLLWTVHLNPQAFIGWRLVCEL